MTREETAKAMEIMQAFVDGARIEFSREGFEHIEESWMETQAPVWDLSGDTVYRIKEQQT